MILSKNLSLNPKKIKLIDKKSRSPKETAFNDLI